MVHVHHYKWSACNCNVNTSVTSSKKHICETSHGIKTDQKDALVANICIAFLSGGRQTVRQLYVIRPRRWKITRRRAFTVFAAIAGAAAAQMCVRERSHVYAYMRTGKKPREFQSERLIHVAWPLFGYRSDLGSHMKETETWIKKITSVPDQIWNIDLA